MNDLTVGQKIKIYRERAKMSQMQLETEVDASTGSISRMENGLVNPTKETLNSISKALKLTSIEFADLLDIKILGPEQLIMGLNKLAESLDMDTMLQTAVDIMINLYPNHNGGVIFLVDKSDNSKLYLQTGSRSPAYDQFLQLLKIKLNQLTVPLNSPNYFARTFNENIILQSFIVTDFTKDIIPDLLIDFVANVFNVKSGITIPLNLDQERMGVIFYSKNKPEKFSAEEIEILKLYTKQIGVSIRNGKMLEDMKKSLDKLKKLSTV